MAMAAGRGVAAVATNSATVTNAATTNAPAVKETPVVKDTPVKTATVSVGSDTKLDFDFFKLVRERNIFDMSRTGRIGTRSVPKRVIVDDFTLVGTMSYEKGLYAFFDGSSSEFRQNGLKPGDKIAGYKIAAIGNDYVDLLSTNSKTIRMGLSTSMRREDKGPWSGPTLRNDTVIADSGSSSSRDTSDRSDRSDRSSRGDRSDRSDRRLYRNRGGGSTSGGMGDPGPGTSNTDSKADSSASSNESDIVKRLMEKRAKETKDNQ